MVTRLDSFLSSSEIADLHNYFGQGLRTVEEFQDPPVTLVILGPDNNFDEENPVATFRVIRIRLDSRDPSDPPRNQGATEQRLTGTLKAWDTDVANVDKRCRFEWNGEWCSITSVEPSRFGYVTIQFEMLQGKVS